MQYQTEGEPTVQARFGDQGDWVTVSEKEQFGEYADPAAKRDSYTLPVPEGSDAGQAWKDLQVRVQFDGKTINADTATTTTNADEPVGNNFIFEIGDEKTPDDVYVSVGPSDKPASTDTPQTTPAPTEPDLSGTSTYGANLESWTTFSGDNTFALQVKDPSSGEWVNVNADPEYTRGRGNQGGTATDLSYVSAPPDSIAASADTGQATWDWQSLEVRLKADDGRIVDGDNVRRTDVNDREIRYGFEVGDDGDYNDVFLRVTPEVASRQDIFDTYEPAGRPFSDDQLTDAYIEGRQDFVAALKNAEPGSNAAKLSDLYQALQYGRSDQFAGKVNAASIQEDINALWQSAGQELSELRSVQHTEAVEATLGTTARDAAARMSDWLQKDSTYDYISGLDGEARRAFLDRETLAIAQLDVGTAREAKAAISWRLAEDWAQNWTSKVDEQTGIATINELLGGSSQSSDVLRFAAAAISKTGGALTAAYRSFDAIENPAAQGRVSKFIYRWLVKQQANPNWSPTRAADLPAAGADGVTEAQRTFLGKFIDSKALKAIGGLGAATALGLRVAGGDTDTAWGRSSAAADALQAVGALDSYGRLGGIFLPEATKKLQGLVGLASEANANLAAPASTAAGGGEAVGGGVFVDGTESPSRRLSTVLADADVTDPASVANRLTAAGALDESQATGFASALSDFYETAGSTGSGSVVSEADDFGGALQNLFNSEGESPATLTESALAALDELPADSSAVDRFVNDSVDALQSGASTGEAVGGGTYVFEDQAFQGLAADTAAAAEREGATLSTDGVKIGKTFTRSLGILGGVGDLMYAARSYQSFADDVNNHAVGQGFIDLGSALALSELGGSAAVQGIGGALEGLGLSVAEDFSGAVASSWVPGVDIIAAISGAGLAIADLVNYFVNPPESEAYKNAEAFLAGDNELGRNYLIG